MFDAILGKTLRATLAIPLLVAGCGGGSAAPTPRPAAIGDPSEVLTITIHNHQLNDARISLWIDRRRQRLGDVRANSSQTFQVPMSGIARVHLEFDLSLGEHCVAGERSLGPGETIEATIPLNLGMIQAVCR